MTAKSLRAKVFSELESLGFRPADSLPLLELDRPIRAPNEVAARLMSLDALFTWVATSEGNAPSKRVKAYISRNGLRDWLTQKESEILNLPRAEAHEAHVDTIGWKLENMWALAWVIGFNPGPTLDASLIGDEIIGLMFQKFLPGLEHSTADLLAKANPRKADEVFEMAYRFYCAHNAVRSAHLGRDTVPKGFHPVIHGGAVHERRHSLWWCIEPGVTWEDTDLNT